MESQTSMYAWKNMDAKVIQPSHIMRAKTPEPLLSRTKKNTDAPAATVGMWIFQDDHGVFTSSTPLEINLEYYHGGLEDHVPL